jgi:hypothetical protein
MLDKKICFQCCRKNIIKERYNTPFKMRDFDNDFNDSWGNGVLYCHLNHCYIILEGALYTDFYHHTNQKHIDECAYLLEHTVCK